MFFLLFILLVGIVHAYTLDYTNKNTFERKVYSDFNKKHYCYPEAKFECENTILSLAITKPWMNQSHIEHHRQL